MYTSEQSLHFAKYSYKTFSNDYKCLREAQKIDGEIEKVFFKSTHSDAQFYTMIKNSGDLVFVFRGSSSVKDFLVDARIFKTSAPDLGNSVAVHAGFYKQYTEVIFDVMASIYSRVRKNQVLYEDENNRNSMIPQINVVFIGHSLGGALASLCCLMAKKSLGSKIFAECHTFGSPRVGNSEFAKLFDTLVDKSERIVNHHDVVTMFPKFLYYHVKGEKKLSYKQESWSDYFGNIQDHYLESYEKSLQRINL